MFDSHCHLDDAAFDRDRAAVLQRAAAAGVTDVLIPAVRPSGFEKLRGLVNGSALPKLHLALGFHPQVVPELTEDELGTLAKLPRLLDDAGAVAVGECGLDGPTGNFEQQEALFRDQIRIAVDLKLPLVVHAFHTHEQVLRTLKQERADQVGGVIHSFSGGAALVSRYLDLGFALSFAGAVTWPRARKPVAAAALVPDDMLLAETDAPDQSPQSMRGQRNEPAMVVQVVAALAAARGQSVEDVQRFTVANARRVFGLTNAPKVLR